MTTEEFAARMDETLRTLKYSPPGRDTERVLALGKIESQNEAKNRVLGIPLLQSVVDELTAFGAELNVTFPVAKPMEARAEAHR